MARSQTALITGASAGIGYELSKIFAREGYNLILVARNVGRLEELAAELRRANQVSVRVSGKDLAQPSAPADLYAELQRDGVTVDVLVNNAGFGSHGFFADSDVQSQLAMIQVNVVAVTHSTRLFLPPMLQRGEGKILNVASTAGFQPGPLMAVYYASKAYVLSFSEALASEVSGSGVTVSALCPGPTATEFQKRAVMERVRLVSGSMMDAATVAEIGYRGLMRNKAVIIPGLKNRLLAFSVRLTPRKMVTQLVKKLNSKQEEKAAV